ncbi:NUDIX domain-containing protein [Micromonospora peucetia]|uniref:NUDIX hydrolase n=1 Tax=Micromonospora peucetia TaxID=47871 RepID=UPI003319E868
MSALTWAVAAVVTDDAGRVLLCRQGRGERRYALPGGRLRPAESPVHAVTRDIRAETGWEIEVVDLVGLYHLTGPSPATNTAPAPPGRPAPDPPPGHASPAPAGRPTPDPPPGHGPTPAGRPALVTPASHAGPLPDVLVHVFRARARGEGPIGDPVGGCRLSWHHPVALPAALTPTTRAALTDALAGLSGALRHTTPDSPARVQPAPDAPARNLPAGIPVADSPAPGTPLPCDDTEDSPAPDEPPPTTSHPPGQRTTPPTDQVTRP